MLKFRLCPQSVHVRKLSNICPQSKIMFSNHQHVNPDGGFSGSKVRPQFVQGGKMRFSQMVGQGLYKPWILRSNLCPGSVKICRGLTDCGPGLDIVWIYPVFFFCWIGAWRSLDIGLTVIGFLSSPCPTKHRKRVPISVTYRHSVRHQKCAPKWKSAVKYDQRIKR